MYEYFFSSLSHSLHASSTNLFSGNIPRVSCRNRYSTFYSGMRTERERERERDHSITRRFAEVLRSLAADEMISPAISVSRPEAAKSLSSSRARRVVTIQEIPAYHQVVRRRDHV